MTVVLLQLNESILFHRFVISPMREMGKDSASLAPGGADGLDFFKKKKKNPENSIFSLFSPGLSRKQRHQP